jgi:hypothetical protein
VTTVAAAKHRHYGQLDAASVNVHDVLAGIPLREDASPVLNVFATPADSRNVSALSAGVALGAFGFPAASPDECTLPVPHVRVVSGAPEEPGVYERIQQGVAHPRVQGPQILGLWLRQMQTRNLGVLGADQLQPVRDRGTAGQSDSVPSHEKRCPLAR